MKPIVSLLASLFVLVASTHAAVPKLINFQGRLTDSNGQPADANVSISLRVYDAENAGQLTYSENIGTVEVINGIYSFRFGSSGSSTRSATETFGPTDGVAQVFNYTAANAPMLTGSASISDGTVTWTEGVSNATLTGNITHSSGAVSAAYLTGVPSSGKTLTLNYDYNSSSIAGALLDNNESWMEVVIDGQAYSPKTDKEYLKTTRKRSSGTQRRPSRGFPRLSATLESFTSKEKQCLKTTRRPLNGSTKRPSRALPRLNSWLEFVMHMVGAWRKTQSKVTHGTTLP